MNYPKTIALVDISHMLTVNFKARANDAAPNDAGQATLNQLAEIRGMNEHTIACLDSPPYWRKLRYNDYKRGREREPEYAAVYNWTVERIEKDGYRIAKVDGQEADDVIATLAHAYAGEDKCRDVRIFGVDKDALQCVDEHVRVFAPKGRGEYEIRDAQWVLEKYEVTPNNMALLLAIMGDVSDNIQGIKGIGVKNAAKLINTFRTPAGMALGLTAAVEASQKPGAKPLAAVWKYYAEGMAKLPLWLALTTLSRRAQLDAADLLKPGKAAPLVQESEDPFGDDPEYDDGVNWDAIAAEESERDRDEAKRAELAASLPVGPAPTADSIAGDSAEATKAMAARLASSGRGGPADRAPIIGKDPGADAFLEKAAAARAMPASGPEQAKVNEAAAQGWERKAAGTVDSSGREQEPEPPKPEPPKPEPAKPAAELVPKTRGPRKQDEIPDPPTETRLAVAAPSWALAAQPSTAKEMLAIASVLYNSRMYSQFGSERGVFAIMALGRELGMGYAEALEAFHNVKDRPCPKAKWLLARMQQHPDCEWIIITHADEKSATIETKHRSFDKPLSLTFTIERAIASGFVSGPNRHNWEKIPRNMLRARVITEAYGDWYPGAAFAFTSAEDMQDRGE